MNETCQELRIKQIFTSMEHLQTNGQAEAANWVILRGIKGRLGQKKVDGLMRFQEC